MYVAYSQFQPTAVIASYIFILSRPDKNMLDPFTDSNTFWKIFYGCFLFDAHNERLLRHNCKNGETPNILILCQLGEEDTFAQ